MPTVVVAVAALLFKLGSNNAELTSAVLLSTMPSCAVAFTAAIKVIVSDAPTASELKVTVRLLPAPPQTPPVEEQETNAVKGGRMSVTVTVVAGSGPLLAIVIV